MARIPRIDLPGIPQHIVQRGNDRQACFADDADYLRYRQELGEAALKHDCTVHAYVLMTNHVHLLAGAQASGGKRGQGGVTSILWTGLASMRSAGGKHHVFEEGSKPDSAGLSVH